MSPQVLRPTFNTLLMRPDVDRLVLKSMTGHATDEMVEHYAGVKTETKRQAVASVFEKREAQGT